MPIYDKPVRLLMRDMVAAMGLEPSQVVLRDEVVEWFRTNFPLVKEGTVHAHLLRLSTNAKTRVHYNAKEDGSDDVFFQIDSSRFRLYQPGSTLNRSTGTRSPHRRHHRQTILVALSSPTNATCVNT